jgi:hypothetical protein
MGSGPRWPEVQRGELSGAAEWRAASELIRGWGLVWSTLNELEPGFKEGLTAGS